MNRIEKEAEEKYPFLSDKADQHTRPKYTYNGNQEERQKAFIAGALSEQARAQKLVEALKECVEVMKVLEEHGILKAVEKDNVFDKSKKTLKEYEEN